MELNSGNFPAFVLESFHQAVVRPGHRVEARRQCPDSLMVVAVDFQAAGLEDSEQEASLLYSDLVRAGRGVAGGAQDAMHHVGPQRRPGRKVLPERAARPDVEKLLTS